VIHVICTPLHTSWYPPASCWISSLSNIPDRAVTVGVNSHHVQPWICNSAVLVQAVGPQVCLILRPEGRPST
jgi:hypothetical protein